jgi:hypothetical protein
MQKRVRTPRGAKVGEPGAADIALAPGTDSAHRRKQMALQREEP